MIKHQLIAIIPLCLSFLFFTYSFFVYVHKAGFNYAGIFIPAAIVFGLGIGWLYRRVAKEPTILKLYAYALLGSVWVAILTLGTFIVTILPFSG